MSSLGRKKKRSMTKTKRKKRRNVGDDPPREGDYMGSQCPNCGEYQTISRGDAKPIAADMLKRKCTCTDCGATWSDELWVRRYYNLRVPTAQQKKAAERKAKAADLEAERQLYKLIGCKRPIGNEQRQWIVCTMCGMVQYFDYVPFSLGTPIRTSACGCWQPDYGWMKRVTPSEALKAYHAYQSKKKS